MEQRNRTAHTGYIADPFSDIPLAPPHPVSDDEDMKKDTTHTTRHSTFVETLETIRLRFKDPAYVGGGLLAEEIRLLRLLKGTQGQGGMNNARMGRRPFGLD